MREYFNKIFAASMLALFLTACGGGGGGSSSTTSSTGDSSGVLVDALVSGVSYVTSSGISGKTDSNGLYYYNAGDTVTFSIGKLTLGTTTATGMLTPLDLVTDTAVGLKIARLLQSLDSDSDGVLEITDGDIGTVNSKLSSASDIKNLTTELDSIITVSEATAMAAMNKFSVYGVYETDSAVAISCNGVSSGESIEFTIALNGGEIAGVLQTTSGSGTDIDILKGEMVNKEKAQVIELTDSGMPKFTLDMTYTDAASVSFTIANETGCSGTGSMSRVAAISNADSSCSSVDIDGDIYNFTSTVTASSDAGNVGDTDTGTVTMSQSGCRVSMDVEVTGSGYDSEVMYGYLDTANKKLYALGISTTDSGNNISPNFLVLDYTNIESSISGEIFYGDVVVSPYQMEWSVDTINMSK